MKFNSGKILLEKFISSMKVESAMEKPIVRDENGRERSGKSLNRSRNCIFWSGTETGTEKSDGKTKSVLRDIGNGINRSGACRLRSGIDNSKWEIHTTTSNI